MPRLIPRTNGDTNDNASAGPAPDPSPLLEEMHPEDFPAHFSEREGRLFPAGWPPYPLPVDTPEAERLDLCHEVIRRLFGFNYVGPVREILGDGQGGQKMVLDLGTAKGKWVMEMAEEFPWVHFRGIDIVPIATQYPFSNVQFEIEDIHQRTRWGDGVFDVVHARSVDLTVTNYNTIIEESARLLRPRGLFISLEWAPVVMFDPRYNSSGLAPASSRFFHEVTTALARRGLSPNPTQIPALLTASRRFAAITPAIHYVPIGEWAQDSALRAIGRDNRQAMMRLADSFEQFLREAGVGEQYLLSIIRNFKAELQETQGLLAALYSVHARKV